MKTNSLFYYFPPAGSGDMDGMNKVSFPLLLSQIKVYLNADLFI